jgi:hypothetical protein
LLVIGEELPVFDSWVSRHVCMLMQSRGVDRSFVDTLIEKIFID